MGVYKFSSTATEQKPETAMTLLYDKLSKGEKLTTAEKHQVFDGLYGMGGSYNSTYRRAGWAFEFGHLLRRFIVRSYDHWQVYYAPNKTCIRKNVFTRTGIKEIHEIPQF